MKKLDKILYRYTPNKGRQFEFCRTYRGATKTEMVKGIKGITTKDITFFERGWSTSITEEHIKIMMKRLDWPVSFLDKRMNNQSITGF